MRGEGEGEGGGVFFEVKNNKNTECRVPSLKDRIFFFSFDNVILLEKLCKKVLYSMAKLFSNQKLFHFFCQVPSFGNVYYYMEYTIHNMGNTVDFLPYMVETVGKGEKGKTGRN